MQWSAVRCRWAQFKAVQDTLLLPTCSPKPARTGTLAADRCPVVTGRRSALVATNTRSRLHWLIGGARSSPHLVSGRFAHNSDQESVEVISGALRRWRSTVLLRLPYWWDWIGPWPFRRP